MIDRAGTSRTGRHYRRDNRNPANCFLSSTASAITAAGAASCATTAIRMVSKRSVFRARNCFQSEEFLIGRRFDRTMAGTLTPREMAVQWAAEWRKGIEANV